MRENVGRIDRGARAVVGPGLMALGYRRFGGDRGDAPGLLVMIAGALIIESAVTRVCPLNALLGIDTRTRRERERDLMRLVETRGTDVAAERAAAMYDARHAVASSERTIDPNATLDITPRH